MLIQKLVMCYSKYKQAALGTAQTVAGHFITLTQRNRAIPNITRRTETNAGEIGGGLHPTDNYTLSAIFEYVAEMLLSSDAASVFYPFAFGTAVETVAGDGFQHVMTATQADSDTLPTMTVYGGLGQGTAEEILDARFVGVAVDTLSLKWSGGIAVDNATLSVGLVGTGRIETNVGFAAPAATSIAQLKPGGITAFTFTPTVGSPINYLSNCQVLSGEATLNNGIKKDGNYRACDAQQNGYTVMGRMRRSATKFALTCQVEIAAGSTEEDLFLASTDGALSLKFEGDVIGAGPEKHTLWLQYARCKVIIESKADADDLVVYNLRFEPLYDATAAYICKMTIIGVQNNILA